MTFGSFSSSLPRSLNSCYEVIVRDLDSIAGAYGRQGPAQRQARGIGFLCVSDEALARGDHPLLVDMRGAAWTAADAFSLVEKARRFEQW